MAFPPESRVTFFRHVLKRYNDRGKKCAESNSSSSVWSRTDETRPRAYLHVDPIRTVDFSATDPPSAPSIAARPLYRLKPASKNQTFDAFVTDKEEKNRFFGRNASRTRWVIHIRLYTSVTRADFRWTKFTFWPRSTSSLMDVLWTRANVSSSITSFLKRRVNTGRLVCDDVCEWACSD